MAWRLGPTTRRLGPWVGRGAELRDPADRGRGVGRGAGSGVLWQLHPAAPELGGRYKGIHPVYGAGTMSEHM